jgi:hypothetical protein
MHRMAAKSEKGSGKASGAKAKADDAKAKAGGAKAAPKTTASKTTARKATSTRRKAPLITDEMIAERAYFIAQSGTGSSDHENWVRAESELRTEA